MKSKNNSNINGGFFFKGGKHQRGVPFQRRYPQNGIKWMVYIGNSYGQMDETPATVAGRPEKNRQFEKTCDMMTPCTY